LIGCLELLELLEQYELSKTVGDEGHGPVSLVILSERGFEALQLLDSQFYL